MEVIFNEVEENMDNCIISKCFLIGASMKIANQTECQIKNIKWCSMILTGFLFIATVGVAYLPGIIQNGMYEYELTFLSNTIVGILFICGGVYGMIKKKDFPQLIYMNSVILLQLVFIICMVFINEFRISGGFLFLHVINPIIATIELLLFTTGERKATIKSILSALIFPAVYFAYVIIYGYISGYWLYGILNIPDRGFSFVLLFVLAVSAGIILIVKLQYVLNYHVFQKYM